MQEQEDQGDLGSGMHQKPVDTDGNGMANSVRREQGCVEEMKQERVRRSGYWVSVLCWGSHGMGYLCSALSSLLWGSPGASANSSPFIEKQSYWAHYRCMVIKISTAQGMRGDIEL